MCAMCSVTLACLTLCDPVGCSPPGSSVHGISPARILKWVAISCARGPSRPRGRALFSCAACMVGDSLPLSYQGRLYNKISLQISIRICSFPIYFFTLIFHIEIELTYHKIHHFKVYTSVVFSIFTRLYIYCVRKFTSAPKAHAHFVVLVQLLSHVLLFVTPWAVAHTRPLCPPLSPRVCANS